MEYNFSRYWISKVLESGRKQRRKPFLKSILIFGLPFDLLLATFFWDRHGIIPSRFIIPFLLALLWVNISPYLIWYYDQALLPGFFDRAEYLVHKQDILARLARKYDTLFANRSWILTIPWIILIVAIVNPLDFILKNAGVIYGFHDPWYWLFMFAVIWVAFLAGVGSWGVVTTLLALREFGKSELVIDPLHHDNRGGLSCVGYYAIGTTVLFASGSLLLPLAFALALRASVSTFLLIAVAIYSILILLSFIYPTFTVNQKARTLRDLALEKLKKKHDQLQEELEKGTIKQNTKMIALYLELHKTRMEYEGYRQVNLYPLNMDILATLVSSVMLPFFFVLIQYYWFR